MKPIRMAAALCCLVASLSTASWSDDDPAAVDEKTVRSLDNRERLAVLRGDVAALEGLWAHRYFVNNPQNFVTPNRGAVMDLVKNGHIKYSSFERNTDAIRLFGDIAIVMGSETVTPKVVTGALVQPIHRRFTNIWQRSGQSWLMIARHANNIPAVSVSADPRTNKGRSPNVEEK